MAGSAVPPVRVFDAKLLLRTGVRHALATNSVTAARLILGGLIGWFIAVQIGKGHHRWEAILFGSGGVLAILLLHRWAEVLKIWIDRQFFREAYDAEKILSELGNKVVSIRDRRQLIETISNEIQVSLHPESLSVLIEQNGCYTIAYSAGSGLSEPATIPPNSSLIRLLRTQHAPLKLDSEDSQSWVHGMSELDQSLLRALRTQALIPISVESRLLGILSLGPKRSDSQYSRADLRLLSAVASQTGLALENVRLLEAVRQETAERVRLIRELEIAREVQERLFPQVLPCVEGLDFAGYCRPAQGVGGDYYDFIRLDNGCLGIAIGDVSGKGIAAALLMASLQASLRAQTILPCDTIAVMIQNVNRLVYEASSQNRYATFFYAQYRPEQRSITYVNAGHNAPILLRARGEVVRLSEGGTVLGMFPQSTYNQRTLHLERGDILLGFTDGVSEAEDTTQAEFGEENLISALRAANTRSAADLISSILGEVDAFAGIAPQHDDMTLVALRVK